MGDFDKKDMNNLIDHILDKDKECERKNIPTHSGFLDLNQQSIILSIKKQFLSKFILWGGFDDAERRVLFFLPDYMDAPPEDALKILEVTHNNPKPLTHRDYLGSILSLGVKRETIGDILAQDKSCQIIILDELRDFFMMNYAQAGRTRLSTEIKPTSQIASSSANSKFITDTVASLRLDAVASSAFGISRSLAVKYIQGGKTFINNQLTLKPDASVTEGDKLSIRGFGKAVLKEISGTSKKGRTFIKLEVFI